MSAGLSALAARWGQDDLEALARRLCQFRGDRQAVLTAVDQVVHDWTKIGRIRGEDHVWSSIMHRWSNGEWHMARGQRARRLDWYDEAARALCVDARRTQRRIAAAYADRFPGERLIPTVNEAVAFAHDIVLAPARPDADEVIVVAGVPRWMAFEWTRGAPMMVASTDPPRLTAVPGRRLGGAGRAARPALRLCRQVIDGPVDPGGAA